MWAIVEGPISLFYLERFEYWQDGIWGLWELHPRNLHPHKWWQAHASAVVIFDICLWQTVKFKLQAKKFYFLYYLSYQREINNRTGSNRYPVSITSLNRKQPHVLSFGSCIVGGQLLGTIWKQDLRACGKATSYSAHLFSKMCCTATNNEI